MLDVVIAVQEPLVRMGLGAAVARSEDMRVAATLDGVEELDVSLVGLEAPVLILDVRFRRADPDLIPRTVRGFPDARVLVYVEHRFEDCIVRHMVAEGNGAQLSHDAFCLIDECCLTSLRQQAHGCIPAEASPDEVVRAVRGVAAGEIVAAPWLAAAHRQGMNGDANGEQKAITPRELEVMALVAKGMGNKSIARQLGIREQTVKNHLARLMSKMGLSNRVEVALTAARFDLRLTSSCEED
jgi:DNA-binding NarL/FixJ family response regulator